MCYKLWGYNIICFLEAVPSTTNLLQYRKAFAKSIDGKCKYFALT